MGDLEPAAAVRTTRATYDAIAGEYRQRTREPFGGLDEQVRAFLGRVPDQGLVADIGCGPGRDTDLLRRHGLTVIGLDLAEGMLREGGLADVAQADMRALPIADEVLDGIWCHAALLHLPLADAPVAIGEFARVLRPGGALHLVVAEGDGEGFQTDMYGGRPRWFSHHRAEGLTAMLGAAGFAVHGISRNSSHRDWLVVDATH